MFSHDDRPKNPITNIDPTEREIVRRAVLDAMEYWPNAHLGENSRREDMRSAFAMIRAWEPKIGLLPAVYRVEDDADAHRDM